MAAGIIYLVSQYQTFSHTFIHREASALRELGSEVVVLSVRPGVSGAPYGRVEPRSLLQRSWSQTLVSLALSLTLPFGALCALATQAAVNSRHRTLRFKLLQIAYVAEAMIALRLLRNTSARHIHVHFANNAVDVARLIVAGGEALTRDAWTYSVAIHGPADFERFDEWGVGDKLRGARFVACISNYARSEVLRRVQNLPADRAIIVRMGLDEDAFEGPRRDQVKQVRRERLNENGERLRLLFVGRLVPEKGARDLINALKLAASSAAIECVVVGDGPEMSLLKQCWQSIESQSQSRATTVQFAGALSYKEVAAWHRWAEVFCLPSYAEGLPVVLMEAMAAGAAVIATPIAGITELVEDRVTGYLVRPGDVTGLASLLVSLTDGTLNIGETLAAADRQVKALHRSRDNAALLLKALSRCS